MKRRVRSPRDRRGVRGRLADFLVTLAFVLRGGSEAKQGQFAAEVRLGSPFVIRPGKLPRGTEGGGCFEGNYLYPYRISSGVHAGDVWLCCVPIDELLRETFQCGGLQRPTFLGSAADQKVQTCSLVNPVSEEPEFIPVCIPAPLTAPPAAGRAQLP